MNIHAEKNQDKKKDAVSNHQFNKQTSLQFETDVNDFTTKTVHQQMADASQQVKQFQAFQEMANQASDQRSTQLKSLPIQKIGEDEEELIQAKFVPIQKMGEDEEELIQAKFAPIQKIGEDEEELIQAKFAPIQKIGEDEEELIQAKLAPIQKVGEEEEELIQAKFAPIQKIGEDEEELIQAKFAPIQKMGDDEEELIQAKFAPIQKMGEDEEELIQAKFAPIQKMGEDEEGMQLKAAPLQKKENNTGLPNQLKAGIENLSGYALDDVKVHYNSPQPAQLQAHAYAQGTDIHIAPGQEQHLAHEAWHVVQQKQGRVRPTVQMKGGVNVNDDAGLENEADVMGAKAMSTVAIDAVKTSQRKEINSSNVVQKVAPYHAWMGSREGFLEQLEEDHYTLPTYSVLEGITVTNVHDDERIIKQLDLSNANEVHPTLKARLLELISSVHIRPATPTHDNQEGNLPGETIYFELGMEGGGGTRLVVDAKTHQIYFSQHYGGRQNMNVDGTPKENSPFAELTGLTPQESAVPRYQVLFFGAETAAYDKAIEENRTGIKKIEDGDLETKLDRISDSLNTRDTALRTGGANEMAGYDPVSDIMWYNERRIGANARAKYHYLAECHKIVGQIVGRNSV